MSSTAAATATPAASNTAASAETNETPLSALPPINSLSRYLYMSTIKNAYTKPRDVILTNIQIQLACAVTMAQERSDKPISVIKKVNNLIFEFYYLYFMLF